MEPAEFSRGVLFPGKNPQPRSNPRQRNKLPVGIFWLRKYSWCQEEILGGNEKSERIWSNDLSQSRVCIQSFCLQSDCPAQNHTPNIFQPGSIPIRLIRFRRMLRISQDLGLGEFCIILKDDSSLGGIHSRKSYHWTLKLIGCKIGSSFFLGFFVVHDIYFRGGGRNLNPSVETNGVFRSFFLPKKTTNPAFAKKNGRDFLTSKGPFSPNNVQLLQKMEVFSPKKGPTFVAENCIFYSLRFNSGKLEEMEKNS